MKFDGGFIMAYDTQASEDTAHNVVVALSYLNMYTPFFAGFQRYVF